MNRLVLALEGYDRVFKALFQSHDEASSDQAVTWLREEVCAVVQELMLSRTFRDTVMWSIEHLPAGCNTSERRAVEEVDRALVACAKALVVFLEAVETLSLSNNGSPSVIAGISDVDREGIRQIAVRPWFDLVYAGEFFEAERGLHLEPEHGSSELAHIFRGNDRWEMPLGDGISRSLFKRVDFWYKFLDRMCHAAMAHANAALYEIYDGIFAAKVCLDNAKRELYELCHPGNAARLRNAAVTLIQVYVAYDPLPHVEWLGAPPRLVEVSGSMIRSLIRRRAAPAHPAEPYDPRSLPVICDPDILRQVAAALNDVRYFLEAPSDPQGMIRWAIDRARLVLVDGVPLAAYWDGEIIAEEVWTEARPEWDLLWTLARNAGRLVTQEILDRYDRNPIKNRRNRLKRLLGSDNDLNRRIESRRGTGGYLLDLDADDIMLLRASSTGSLEIVGRNSTLPSSAV